MMSLLFLGAASALALAGAQPPEGPDGPMGPRGGDVTRQQVIDRVDQRFARLDANSDGRFTPEDAQALGEQRREQRAEQMFDMIDRNHDGSITREEAREAHARHMAMRGERGPGRGFMHHRRMRMGWHGGMRGGRMFGEQGFVTREQLRERALARFDRADANHDGTLTAEERRAARGQFRERLRERRGEPG